MATSIEPQQLDSQNALSNMRSGVGDQIVNIRGTDMATSIAKLPVPKLVVPTDIDEIKQAVSEDREFWRRTYGEAKRLQAAQDGALKDHRNQVLETQKGDNAFATVPDMSIVGPKNTTPDKPSESVTELKRLNEQISVKNKDKSRSAHFGYVRAMPLNLPVLEKPADSQILEKDYDIQTQLAPLHQRAFEYQHYWNNYHKATLGKIVNYEKTYEDGLLKLLHEVNEDIAKETESMKVDKGFGIARVPQQGDDELVFGIDADEPDEDEMFSDEPLEHGMYHDASDKPHIEERGRGKNGQTQQPSLPKKIQAIRKRMGGEDGLLRKVIRSRQEINKNNPRIMEEGQKAQKLIEGLQDESDRFCDSVRLPRETYGIETQVFYGMADTALTIFEQMKDDPEDTTIDHQYQIHRKIAETWLLQHQIPDDFLPAIFPSIEKARVAVQEELTLREPDAMDIDANETRVRVGDQSKEGEFIPLDRGVPAISPVDRTGHTKSHGPRSSKPNRMPTIVSTAPPAGNTVSQCISTDVTPDTVMESVGGQLICKRIVGFRKVGWGNQLLLKSQGTNPAFPERYIFELVAANEFGRQALEEYKSTGLGHAINTASRGYLKDKRWSQALIGGVANVRRDDTRLYKVEAVTYVMLTFPGTDFVWINRSELSKMYGRAQIKGKIDQYRIEAGQDFPKPPTKRVFVPSHSEQKALQKAIWDSGYDFDDQNTPSKKKTHRATRPSRRYTIDDDAEEEIQSEATNDEEDGQEEEDSGPE